MAERIKHISEQKLKAFSIGAMGKRPLSKREIEEQRKKEEEKAAAHVFQEFVETFQETAGSASKVWVKAGTYDAGARKEDTKDKGKLYKPQSRVSGGSQELATSAERAQAYARMLAGDKKPERLGRKKSLGKSNLEMFKEELKLIQEEREERHKYKGVVRSPIEAELDLLFRTGDVGSFDSGDPTTTNIYLGNLNPKITEQQLLELFGRFGPLASIKIMWPRSDEEKARCRNCGFVAYMSRNDGERAIYSLSGKDVLGYEMKLGWGKSIIIPPVPIYIPPSLLKLSLPPPPSGLPFNAQPIPKDRDRLPTTAEELTEILSRAVVKVVIPTDRNLLMLIHRMVEFVIREGPMFEAMIMNREISNPLFRFLFENQSPGHIYFRWKLYSIMHGEAQKEWSQKEFRMFTGGSIWKPPIVMNYTNGMPEELVLEEEARDPTKGSLSNTQRDRLEELIRNITPENKKIGDAMVFCIEHSDAADEVAECLLESLSNDSTILIKKIARLYLISDILHNCGVKVINASYYRRAFEMRLIDIIEQMKYTHDNLDGRLKAEGFKIRILRTLKSWEDSIYPKEFMTKLHNIFLGREMQEEFEEAVVDDENWDGNPLQDRLEDDDDDIPMDGAALLKSVLRHNKSPSIGEEDIDGFEIQDDNIDNDDNSKLTVPAQLSGFIVSKWETVDPEQVEAQAMTTSKWDLLEASADNSKDSRTDTRDSIDLTDPRDMTEDKRIKLREIEVKAMHYQDELESGQRSVKNGWTVPQQVAHYRRKLLRKSEKDVKEEDSTHSERRKRDWEKIDSSDDEYYKESTSRKNKKLSRSSASRSASKHRSKSRSPSSRKKSAHIIVSPPSPPRIKRRSPSSSKSRHKNSISPDSSNGKYSSPSLSKYGKYSPSSPKSARYSRKSSPSPVRYRSPSSHSSRSRYKATSPVSRKHKHKHRR